MNKSFTILRGHHNQYQWGRVGSESLVYHIQNVSGKVGELKQEERYSELWMGTHPNGPSIVDESGDSLSKFLQESGAPFDKLPFLFKVLSIDKPLSIQAHPDKKLAEELHKNSPHIYKDDNHKPEMACALTPFEALCGFRKNSDIHSLLSAFGAELVELLGGNSILKQLQTDNGEETLKNIFATLMELDDKLVSEKENQMMERITLNEKPSDFENLLKYVHSHFPGDVGVFCVFLLNYIKLQPGQAIFLGPNLPHAYLSGNCIECMACSDNVVRAGLTPKLRDANTLCNMLEYNQSPVDVLTGNIIDEYCSSYSVPVNEFILYRVSINDSLKKYSMPRPENDYPAILLTLKGKATLSNGDNQTVNLKEGEIIYIPPGISLEFLDIEDCLEVYYCTCKTL